jgi:Flp pilus assembly protein CpaB
MPVKERKLPREPLHRAASSRGGLAAVAVFAAVLAAAVLVAFMSNYKDSVNGTSKPAIVLVAKGLIEKGSSGDVIASKSLFETTTARASERRKGALSDPSSLRGRQAATDIYPGEQLVASDFTKASNSLVNKVSDRERAISLPLDSAHGMIGDVKAGDHVDVLAGFNVQPDGAARPRPVLRAVMQNALVLEAPDKPKQGALIGPNNAQSVVLRAPDADAWNFAFSSEFGKVWIVLRPKVGAEQTKPSLVTLERLLFGLKPITVERLLRGTG